MRSVKFFVFAAVLTAVFASAADARAAALRSRMANQRDAVMEYSGFYLNPIGTVPESDGDLAPSQLFEIVRPGNQAITLGRLYTSCVCVALESTQDSFAEGEHAVVRLRNIRLSPPAGQMYAIYVQITGPVRTILRFDTFMRSSQFLPSKPGEAPTRGDIVADGVLPAAEAVAAKAAAGAAEGATGAKPETLVAPDGVEIIVPKADNYIPDTSEYTLRKQKEAAEAAAAAKDKVVSEVAIVEGEPEPAAAEPEPEAKARTEAEEKQHE